MGRFVLLLFLCLTASGIRAVPAFKAEKKKVAFAAGTNLPADQVERWHLYQTGTLTIGVPMLPQKRLMPKLNLLVSAL